MNKIIEFMLILAIIIIVILCCWMFITKVLKKDIKAFFIEAGIGFFLLLITYLLTWQFENILIVMPALGLSGTFLISQWIASSSIPNDYDFLIPDKLKNSKKRLIKKYIYIYRKYEKIYKIELILSILLLALVIKNKIHEYLPNHFSIRNDCIMIFLNFFFQFIIYFSIWVMGIIGISILSSKLGYEKEKKIVIEIGIFGKIQLVEEILKNEKNIESYYAIKTKKQQQKTEGKKDEQN